MRSLLSILTAIILSPQSFALTPNDAVKNTSTPACVATVGRFLQTLSAYWSLPSISNLSRTDTLTPTLTTSSGLQGRQGSSTQTITYYSLNSTFNTSGNEIVVTSSASSDGLYLNSGTKYISIGSQYYLNLSNSRAVDCNAGTKWKSGQNVYTYAGGSYGNAISFYKSTDGTTFTGIFTINNVASLCSNSARTFAQLLSSAISSNATTNLTSAVRCLQSDCTNNISELSAITSSTTLQSFCANIQD